MTVIEITSGMEHLQLAELKVTAWYVPYARCPIGLNNSNKPSMSLGQLVKLGMRGKNGEAIERIDTSAPFHLNPVHRVEALRQKQTAWYNYKYNCPDGLIFKIAAFESISQFGAAKHIGNLFFRVRENAAYLEVNFKNPYGLDYLVKGRLDRLSPEYIIKNQLIGHPSEIGSIGDTVIDNFMTTTILKPATKEITNYTKESVLIDDHTIVINRHRKERDISSLI